MIDVAKSITINRLVAEVFAYVSDSQGRCRSRPPRQAPALKGGSRTRAVADSIPPRASEGLMLRFPRTH
jgi:hypothetical protein